VLLKDQGDLVALTKALQEKLVLKDKEIMTIKEKNSKDTTSKASYPL
jgi:hypothetical protein